MLVKQAALADEFCLKQPITGPMVTEVLVLLEEMTNYAKGRIWYCTAQSQPSPEPFENQRSRHHHLDQINSGQDERGRELGLSGVFPIDPRREA